MELRDSRFSLFARLLALATVAVLPALGLLVYYDVTLRTDREIEAQTVAREQVNLAAAQVRQTVGTIRSLLTTLSRLRAVRNHDAAGCAATLEDVERQFSHYLALAVTDAEGQIVCPGRAFLTDASVRDRGLFQAALTTKRFVSGNYAFDVGTGERAILFAYPYFDANEDLAGVILAALNLDWLTTHLRDMSWLPGSTITLADRDGTVLVRLPETERIGSVLSGQLRPLLSAGNVGTTTRVGRDGRGWVTAYSPIVPGENEIFTAVELSQDEALAEVNQTIRHGAFIILTSFLVALAAAAIAGRYFIGHPVDKLLHAADKLSLGDYSVRTQLTHSAPEFRRLASAFDRMAQVIQNREQELRDANRAKNQLLAAAGHDLKQPLQVLSMAVEQLGGRDATPQASHHLRRADWAIQRLARALDNLLQGSLIESGALMPAKQLVLADDVLCALADTFAPLAREKRLRFSVVRSSAVIESDPHLLWEMLQNLVDNAIKYTAKGRILVGCRRRGDILSIQVIDTGSGIPESQFDLVFEEFHRLNPQSGSGVGLGLAVVRRIARLLGHSIELRSKVGKGSCFAMQVPLAPRTAAEETCELCPQS
ncbi:MAG TPA: sensor histidine kinase [Stellaceae bacterium]|nr:sensor histidine kinase [Stellaceae bacterium]